MLRHSPLKKSLGAIDRAWKSAAFITLGTVCLTAGTGNAQAATVIDTTPYPVMAGTSSSTEGAPYYGYPGGSESFGQTFTAPTNGDNILSSFSIGGIERYFGTVKLRALVMGWDGLKPTGSVLYQSDVHTLISQSQLRQTLSFSTDGVALSAGSQYVAFLTSIFDLDGIPDAIGRELVGGFGSPDAYSGGSAVALFGGSYNLAQLTTENWEVYGGIPDLPFTAEFTSGATAVPTPALLPGSLGLGFGVLRKRKAAQAEEAAK